MDIAHIDAGLQQLQEILREEILNNQRLSAPADSAASNDASRTSELISALSKVGELEHAAAQSDLMKKAALNALRASQAELCRLQEGSEAQKQQVEQLREVNRQLRLTEAQLSEPGRIDVIAKQLGLNAPEPGQVVRPDGAANGAVLAQAQPQPAEIRN